MGWTFFPHYGQSSLDLIKREVPDAIEIAKRGNTFYMLVQDSKGSSEHFECDPDGSYRYLLVALTKRDGGEFGYKLVDESMGPYETNCPKGLIKRASPIKAGKMGYATEWRAKCLAKTSPKRPPLNKLFSVAQPVKFRNGVEATRFQRVQYGKRSFYVSPDVAGNFRFNPDRYGGWTLIP
jgi:hypothetical protein